MKKAQNGKVSRKILPVDKEKLVKLLKRNIMGDKPMSLSSLSRKLDKGDNYISMMYCRCKGLPEYIIKKIENIAEIPYEAFAPDNIPSDIPEPKLENNEAPTENQSVCELLKELINVEKSKKDLLIHFIQLWT